MKTVIEMVREVGLIVDANQSGFDSVEAFAALVRADAQAEEREALIDLIAFYGNSDDLQAAIRARGNT